MAKRSLLNKIKSYGIKTALALDLLLAPGFPTIANSVENALARPRDFKPMTIYHPITDLTSYPLVGSNGVVDTVRLDWHDRTHIDMFYIHSGYPDDFSREGNIIDSVESPPYFFALGENDTNGTFYVTFQVPEDPQPPSTIVHGNVKEILNDVSVDSALVVISDENGGTVDSSYTDSLGNYNISLPRIPSTYFTTVSKPRDIYQWPMEDLNGIFSDTLIVSGEDSLRNDKDVVEDYWIYNNEIDSIRFIDFFREVCEGGQLLSPTQRWSHSPAILFNPDYMDVPPEYIDIVQDVILNDLPLFTNGVITPYLTTNEDSAEIYVGFLPSQYFPPGDAGLNTIDNDNPDNFYEITSGSVALGDWLVGTQRRRIALHEFGQVLGIISDTYNVTNSIFYFSIPNIMDYSVDDLKIGKALYNYEIGQNF
ncbi:hypothetical protein K8R47_00810 [archaeon]|nr:hypothetical protein [archaeon]